MAESLRQRLKTRLALSGPMTVADYMSEALANPRHGYYRHRDPLGTQGDFITAPEISQVFGELIGAWLAERWQALGSPEKVLLVELGPGRGTLMADALRATRSIAGFHAAIDLHLVEINETLKQMQREAIGKYVAPHWHDGFASLPEDAPLLLVANEFFDALPIRQLQRTTQDWRERLVSLQGETLRFALAPGPSPLSALLSLTLQANAGAIAEISLPARALARDIGERIARRRGAALIVDYGYASPRLGDSLQAVAQHKVADPLAAPGEADLSAHVDFAALAQSAQSARAMSYGPTTQGEFLQALGIHQRLAALTQRADATQAAVLEGGVQRLIAPRQMGTLFKVLALTDLQSPAPAGFAAIEE
ncbi:MAG: methyltransferase [Alphaproteobacteria bacterium]|nr:methyltransferase [Alphaproteobacteria bacterium]